MTRKRKAPSERLEFKSPKQKRTERAEAAEGLLLLPQSFQSNVESSLQTETAPMYTATICEQKFKDMGTLCKPETQSRECQTERPVSSEVVKLSIQNKILENDLKTQQSEFEIKKPSTTKKATKQNTQFNCNFGVDSIKDDDIAFKLSTGLTFAHLLC